MAVPSPIGASVSAPAEAITLGASLQAMPRIVPASFTMAAPSGLKSTGAVSDSISLAWNTVAGAPKYRVQYSANADMSYSNYARFDSTSGTVGGLKANTRYYFKVRVISIDGANLGPYSSAIAVQSAATQLAVPTGLIPVGQTASSILLSWNAVSGAPGYRIQASTKADMSGANYYRFTGTTADIRSLQPDTIYYFKVRVIGADGTNLSAYSSAAQTRTRAQSTSLPAIVNPLTVASFNIKCANCYSAIPNELPWTGRRDAIVASTVKQRPDVVGFQEASQGWLANEPRPGGLTQFEDLKERLVAAGVSYEVTNAHRNNCVKSTTPTSCVYQDQGASKGTKIFYNKATVDLVRQGSVKLPSLAGSDNERYFAWAVLTQKSTGKSFFFGDTQLEPNPADGYYDLRKQQATAITAAIKANNPQNLPVVAVGDFNSHKWTNPSNAPYDVMLGAGLVDPLGNTYKADLPSGQATVENRIRTNFDSYNGFLTQAKARNDFGNGTYLDYIFTSKMRVGEWETVVHVDANRNFIGVIPSDHNMIRATVGLP